MTHRSINLTPSLLVACFSLSACGANGGDGAEAAAGDLAGVPELAAVEIQLTGAPESEGLATSADAVDPENLVADELEQTSEGLDQGDPSSELAGARAALRELNESLRDFLLPVAALVRHRAPDKEVGRVKIWGPVERGATEYRFLLRRRAAEGFEWRLDARPSGSADAFARVAAGRLTPGARPRRGAGVAGFDMDVLGSVDPTVAARGRILVGFAHGERGTSVRYALDGFRRSDDVEGIDALLGQVRLSGGIRRVRLAYRGDVAGTESALDELVLARARHTRGAGGRGDLIVTGGDVPEGEARVMSQCWDEALSPVYSIVRACPMDGIDGETCTTLSTEGDSADCAPAFAAAELPPLDAMDPMSDPEDPHDDVAVPPEIPEVDEAEEG